MRDGEEYIAIKRYRETEGVRDGGKCNELYKKTARVQRKKKILSNIKRNRDRGNGRRRKII